MKYLKSFNQYNENIDTGNDAAFDDQTMPEYNPDINLRAKEYVEGNIVGNNYNVLFDLADMEFPENVSPEEMKETEEIAIQKAIAYFIENPEMMNEPNFDYVKRGLNTIVPKLQNM